MQVEKARILVIDDEEIVCKSCHRILTKAGYDVSVSQDPRSALRLLEKEPYDVVITDLMMPEVGGMDILKTVKEVSPDTEVIIITGYGTIKNAVEATKIGARDYIPKPFTPKELNAAVEKALEEKKLLHAPKPSSESKDMSAFFDNIIGPSPKMQEVFKLIIKVAATSSTVLIIGESGTGKELVARAIHNNSHRKNMNFVVVDCTTLSPTLLESELFGHVKGSFTGAVATKPGYFEVATVGGEEVKSFNIITYDSQGGSHVLSGAFVRTDTVNLWDLVLTSISGDVSELAFADRRIEGIEFNGSDGSFAGLNSGIGDTSQFTVTFAHDTANPQVITVDMGTQGQYNGLTQFARESTAVAKEQDGYPTGDLSNVSVSSEGYIIGSFTNGVKKNLATIQLTLFKNPPGLESGGNGYFTSSVNSGEPIATQGLIGGAGMIHGGSLEKSNADVASLFVSMIEAQNGYHANARTIKIANDMLKELTNLIR